MTGRTGATGLPFSLRAILLAAVALPLAANLPPAAAQQEITPEMINQIPPEHREKALAEMRKRGMNVPGDQPADAAKPAEGKKPDGDKKPEEGKKDEGGGATIKRPTEKPEDAADVAKVAPDKPDANGMVQFEFRGQPWLDVLEWYAGVAGKSFDWQELPGDFLNLSTQRPYTLEETRDLLNSLLMARGYTMVLRGDVLSVVKIDKLDPSFVPRVEPEALDDYPPHDIVRTRFPLPPEMDPAKAVEDVKLLLNPTAKVTPLLATRQLQIIDAIGNLRDVRDLLTGEQLKALEDVRPRPFVIQHRRADYIADQVMIVLGLDPAARKNPMELQLEQQRMQLMMQMQQRGADVSKMLKQDGPKVFIAVDKLRNVMLVNAPEAEMKIIERTVEQFDVPQSGVAAAETSPGAPPVLTMDRYPTESTDAVVTALKEIGSLHPLTQLQSDSRADVIFAYATAEDHETIKRMISKLDAGGRTPWVIPLNRSMPADQAAGTIQALLVGEQKEEDNNSRRGYYSFYDFYGGRDRDNDDEAQFRVQADIENNRLLLWASDAEYKEVHSLLETLGAVSTGKNRLDRLRVLEAGTPEETAKLLERLKETWAGENRLEIDASAAPAETPSAKPPAADPAPAEEKAAEPENRDKLTLNPRPRMWLAQFAEGVGEHAPSESSEKESPEQPAEAKPAPPVKVTVTEDGRMLLSSDDPEALDQLEDLIAELAPPQKEFEAFFLKNSDAYDVWWNLKDYFEDELKGQTEAAYDMWGEYEGRKKVQSGPTSLGRRRLLRFIYDTPTNSIVVQNASEAQLAIIRQLVAIYDKPLGEDSVVTRRTEVIQVQYSRAAPIAAALKEVYRDLLSSKDKEFQSRDGQQRSSRTETYFRFYGGGGEDDKKSSPVKVAFEGALSIGVDEISNTLLISAEETVFEKVKELITELDKKAMPNTIVQVRQVRGSIQGKDLKTALAAALSQPWPGGKPQAAAAQGQQRGDGDNNNGDRNNNDGDRRRSRDNDGDND